MAMAAGGPNKGKKASYFADRETLETELRCYLRDREAGPPKSSEGSASGNTNPLLSFFSVDPSASRKPDPFAEDANTEEELEWVGEPDALSYSELTRYGYRYLIEPMMDQGGYVAVSERMGVSLNARRATRPPGYRRGDVPVLPREQLREGFLALGSALNERIDAAADLDASAIKRKLSEDIFSRQASIGIPAAAKGGIRTPVAARSSSSALDAAAPVFRTAKGGGRDAETTAQLADEERRREPLTLSAVQRAYLVAFVGAAALGFGRATPEAVAAGLLPAGGGDSGGFLPLPPGLSLQEAAQYAATFLAAANAASVALSAVLAGKQGRSVPLWSFKAALAGLATVVELRGLGPLEQEN
ncbi:unnamed protein product [Phaeothamnion confervicola]